MELENLCSNAVVLQSLVVEYVATTAAQSFSLILAMLGSLPSSGIDFPQEPGSCKWLTMAEFHKTEQPESENKDADGDDGESDADAVAEEEGDDDDDCEEVNNEGNPKEEPEANGKGVEGKEDNDDDDNEEEDDDDDDDDDDEDDEDDAGEDDEDEDEDNEEEEEEEEPPSKKRKGA